MLYNALFCSIIFYPTLLHSRSPQNNWVKREHHVSVTIRLYDLLINNSLRTDSAASTTKNPSFDISFPAGSEGYWGLSLVCVGSILLFVTFLPSPICLARIWEGVRERRKGKGLSHIQLRLVLMKSRDFSSYQIPFYLLFDCLPVSGLCTCVVMCMVAVAMIATQAIQHILIPDTQYLIA